MQLDYNTFRSGQATLSSCYLPYTCMYKTQFFLQIQGSSYIMLLQNVKPKNAFKSIKTNLKHQYFFQRNCYVMKKVLLREVTVLFMCM